MTLDEILGMLPEDWEHVEALRASVAELKDGYSEKVTHLEGVINSRNEEINRLKVMNFDAMMHPTEPKDEPEPEQEAQGINELLWGENNAS